MHPGAETDAQRLRRECLAFVASHSMLSETCARNIMEHCFGVALQLLNKNGFDISKGL